MDESRFVGGGVMKYNRQAFCDLEDKEKFEIVKKELSLETHNGTTKDDLLMLLDWTFNRLAKGDLRISDNQGWHEEQKNILAIGSFCTECEYAWNCLYPTIPFSDDCMLRGEKNDSDMKEIYKAIEVIRNHINNRRRCKNED